MQLRGVVLRRTKDEVLDLPPKIRNWMPVSVAEGTARKEMRKVLERLTVGAAERAVAGSRRRPPTPCAR